MRRLLEQWVVEKESTGKWGKTMAKKSRQWGKRFAREIKSLCGVTSLSQLNENTLEEYRSKKLSHMLPGGRIWEEQRLFSFLKWCIACGLLLAMPINWKRSHCVKTLPRALTVEQVKTVIETIDIESKSGIQDRAIVELFYATAIRINELISLNISDIDLQKKRIWVRNGKGGKNRVLPLIPSAKKWIRLYLSESRSHLIKDLSCQSLFIGKAGGRISASHIDRLMKRLRELTGIKPLSAHIIRHSSATHLMEQDVPLPYIQKFLGHSFLSTTQRYLQIVPSQLQKKYDLSHPRDKMKLPEIDRYNC